MEGVSPQLDDAALRMLEESSLPPITANQGDAVVSNGGPTEGESTRGS